FMPFITEELWQNTPHKGESIVVAAYPSVESGRVDVEAETQIAMIQDVIAKVRNIRAEMNVDAKQPVKVRIATTDPAISGVLSGARDYIFRLAQVSEMEIVPALSGDKLAAQAVAGGCALEVPLAGLIDVESERARLSKEMEKVQREIKGLEGKLSNAS